MNIPRSRRYPMRPITPPPSPPSRYAHWRETVLGQMATAHTVHPDPAMRGTFKGLLFRTDEELDEWFADCREAARPLRPA